MMEPEELLATLAILFAHKGAAREVAALTFAEASFDDIISYGFNDESYLDGIRFLIKVPIEIYAQISESKENMQELILQKARSLSDFNKSLKEVFIDPIPPKGNQWRDKARAWLAGSGVNNQGRIRSDNIASRERDGLLFRSEPEIFLYMALKSLGVSFAPLAVFIKGGQNYRRIEPDFVIIKDGLVMVVEVDGDTVHLESPAEAHDRTTMLAHEGAIIDRRPASDCDTPQKAALCAKEIVSLIEKHKASRR